MQYRNPRLVNKLRKLPKKLAKQKRIQECLKETGDNTTSVYQALPLKTMANIYRKNQ